MAFDWGTANVRNSARIPARWMSLDARPQAMPRRYFLIHTSPGLLLRHRQSPHMPISLTGPQQPLDQVKNRRIKGICGRKRLKLGEQVGAPGYTKEYAQPDALAAREFSYERRFM